MEVTIPDSISESSDPSTAPTECETLTIREASGILGVSLSSAYEAAQKGQIPAIRIGGRWLVLKGKFQKMLAGEED